MRMFMSFFGLQKEPCQQLVLFLDFSTWLKCQISPREKRRGSESVLWQKLVYQQKIQQPTDNTKTPPKTSITQRLRTDLGRSVRVTTAIQLVWLNRFTIPNLPTNHKSRVIKRTHRSITGQNCFYFLQYFPIYYPNPFKITLRWWTPASFHRKEPR